MSRLILPNIDETMLEETGEPRQERRHRRCRARAPLRTTRRSSRLNRRCNRDCTPRGAIHRNYLHSKYTELDGVLFCTWCTRQPVCDGDCFTQPTIGDVSRSAPPRHSRHSGECHTLCFACRRRARPREAHNVTIYLGSYLFFFSNCLFLLFYRSLFLQEPSATGRKGVMPSLYFYFESSPRERGRESRL